MKIAVDHNTHSATQIQRKSDTAPFFAPRRAGGGKDVALAEPFFQPELTVGAPNDQYEKEADRVADRVEQRLATHPVPETTVQAKLAGPVAPAHISYIQCSAVPEFGEQPEPEMEEAAVQRKPIFESDGVGEVQRKCAACAAEEEVMPKRLPALQRSGDGGFTASDNFSGKLNSSKGGGSPLPADTRQSMESAIGADFSGVRVHTGSHAAGLSNQIGAKAFTHGSDVYFNPGKYDPGSTGGQHLLAHELTHTVQQGKSPARILRPVRFTNTVDDSIQRVGISDLKYLSPAYWQYRAARWVGEKAWSASEGLREELATSLTPPISALIALSKNPVFDIRGKTAFVPDAFMWRYILEYFYENRTNRVPVRVRYGSLGSGTIILQANANYGFSTTGKFLLAIDHPALSVKDAEKAIALEVEVTDNKISGTLGVPKARTGNDLKGNRDLPQISFGGLNREDLFTVVYGETYEAGTLNVALYENKLQAGFIKFLVGGHLPIDHGQSVTGGMGIVDNQHFWSAHLQTDIIGTAPYQLEVERTPGGFLSGASKDLALDGKWTGEGFSLQGGLQIALVDRSVELYGKAKYTSKQLSGEVNIAVLPKSKAEETFRNRAPGEAQLTPTLPAPADPGAAVPAPPVAVPSADEKLALTAWGNGAFTLIDKAKKLSGTAAFAVSPEGYVVTAGLIKLQKDFILMDALKKSYELFNGEVKTQILLGEVPVRLRLEGSLTAGYQIGPVVLYELTATGAYSTHPDYPDRLCLGAKLEMPAQLYAKVDLIAAAAVAVDAVLFEITIVEAAARVSATGSLDAYVNAQPSIGVSMAKGKEPEYCLAGIFSVGGQLGIDLDGEFTFSVLRKVKAKEPPADPVERSKNVFRRLSIGDFGFQLDADYTLGDNQSPEFAYKGKNFDADAFKAALKKKDSTKKEKPKLRGGLEQEGEQKGVVDDESIKDREVEESNNPLGPFELVQVFTMNGTPHRLYLLVAGKEGAPEVRIEMESDRGDYVEKLDEEIALLTLLTDQPWYVDNGLTEEDLLRIDARIKRLQRLKAKAGQVIESVTTTVADPETPDDIAAPGFETLDNETADYGNQFHLNDLGETEGHDQPGTSPGSGTYPAPPGVEIRLVLPPQKAMYLSLYRSLLTAGPLQHSTGREERDTDQQSNWDKNIQAAMPRGTYCQGRGLSLSKVDILRPYWSSNYLDASRRSRKKPKAIDPAKIPRMQVDHVIEWQTRPLTGGAWVDQPWNFELLDQSSNGSSGPKMKNNIQAERERLATLTGDPKWLTEDITFTVVVVQGSAEAERWSNEQIEDGDHLDAYRILTGETVDPEKESAC